MTRIEGEIVINRPADEVFDRPVMSEGQSLAATRTWWRDRRVEVAIAAASAGLAGVAAAGLMPRGPTTRAEALALMAGVLLVGAATGLLSRSRWALLLAPVLYLAGFELARATVFDVPGVTFGPVHLDTSGGMLLFAVGHGFYALVTVPPLVLGAILGAASARRRAPQAPVRRTGVWQALYVARRGLAPLLAGLLAVGVGFAAVRTAQTGRVEPFVGADGRTVPGSIAVHEQVRLGGADQWISIRGRSVDNPVLLYLSGGPGGSDLGYVRYRPGLEDHFTVVVWEQRGTGMSYPSIDPTSRMTLDQMVSDGIQLSRLLTRRFDERGSIWSPTPGAARSAC
jgi:proline iminopeptidase